MWRLDNLLRKWNDIPQIYKRVNNTKMTTLLEIKIVNQVYGTVH